MHGMGQTANGRQAFDSAGPQGVEAQSGANVDYRAFLIDAGGEVIGRHDLECDSDGDALDLAFLLVDRHDIEVWQSNRIVGKLNHRQWPVQAAAR
jgi:hypothetical protein